MAGAVIAPPPAPVVCVVKCTTSPVRARADCGAIARVRTGFAITVTVVRATACPLRPTRRAWPGDTPVMRPAASTVATAGVSDVHSICTSPRGSPFGVRATPASVMPAPTASGAFRASMSIRATLCGLTTIVAKPGLPPTIAPTRTSPGTKTVTDPFSSIAAAESNGAANQAVGFRSRTLPSSSKAEARKVKVWPTSPSTLAGVTSTRAGRGPAGGDASSSTADRRNCRGGSEHAKQKECGGRGRTSLLLPYNKTGGGGGWGVFYFVWAGGGEAAVVRTRWRLAID